MDIVPKPLSVAYDWWLDFFGAAVTVPFDAFVDCAERSVLRFQDARRNLEHAHAIASREDIAALYVYGFLQTLSAFFSCAWIFVLFTLFLGCQAILCAGLVISAPKPVWQCGCVAAFVIALSAIWQRA